MTITTPAEGQPVREYLCVVAGECMVGAKIFADFSSAFATSSVAALVELSTETRNLGADAVIGIDLDYEVLGKEGSMLMVTASGTAVQLR